MCQLPFNSFRALALAFILLTLGQVSCSPDKRSPPGQIQRQVVDDHFKLEAPVIRRADGQKEIPLTSAFSTPLSTEDELVFPSVAVKKENEKRAIRFIVHTSCRSGNTSSEAIATIQNRSELRFRDLMPLEVFFQARAQVHLKDEKVSSTPCKFEVTALNPVGSEIHYRIQAELTISRNTLGFRMSSNKTDLDINPTSGQEPLVLTEEASQILFQDQMPSVGEARLICEGFEHRVQFGPQSPLSFSSILASAPFASGARSFVPLTAKPQQLCRLLVVSTPEDREVQVSRHFLLQGESSPLEIYAHFELNGYDSPRPNRIHVLGIGIRNNNDIAVPVSISLPSENSLILQPILHGTLTTFLGWRFAAPIKLSLAGGKISAATSGQISYLIPPHDEIIINGHAEINTVCFAGNADSRQRPGEGHLGYYYSFDTGSIVLRQSADNHINNDGTINASYERKLFKEIPASTFRPLPGWAPWTKNGGWSYQPFRDLREPLQFADVSKVPYSPLDRTNVEYGCSGSR